MQKNKSFLKILNWDTRSTNYVARYGNCTSNKMMIAGDFVLGKLAVLMLLMLVVSMLASSIPLPFIFKLGVEKEGLLTM